MENKKSFWEQQIENAKQPLRIIEAQIGFTIGILIGALMAGIFIIFFTPWEWYWKLFSGIGSLGIVGNLVIALSQLLKSRKDLIEVQEEMKNMELNTRGNYVG